MAQQTDQFADVAPQLCALCSEAMDISQTAVAVMQSTGDPGLVHPGCYPAFAVRERSRDNPRFADSPFRDLEARRTEAAPDSA